MKSGLRCWLMSIVSWASFVCEQSMRSFFEWILIASQSSRRWMKQCETAMPQYPTPWKAENKKTANFQCSYCRLVAIMAIPTYLLTYSMQASLTLAWPLRCEKQTIRKQYTFKGRNIPYVLSKWVDLTNIPVFVDSLMAVPIKKYYCISQSLALFE